VGVRRLAGVIESEIELVHTFGSAGPASPPSGSAVPAPDLA
jgi:hypothetical protein